MEEDIDTRKINNSFLRDHSYATEGNASSAAFRRWGRVQVADSCASPVVRRLMVETPLVSGAGALGGGSGQALNRAARGGWVGMAHPSGTL